MLSDPSRSILPALSLNTPELNHDVRGAGDDSCTRTPEEQLREFDRISARVSALAAEKARIDAGIAAATAESRTLFEDRHFRSSAPRRGTNPADTTTASEPAYLLRISHGSALTGDSRDPAQHQSGRSRNSSIVMPASW